MQKLRRPFTYLVTVFDSVRKIDFYKSLKPDKRLIVATEVAVKFTQRRPSPLLDTLDDRPRPASFRTWCEDNSYRFNGWHRCNAIVWLELDRLGAFEIAARQIYDIDTIKTRDRRHAVMDSAGNVDFLPVHMINAYPQYTFFG